MQVIKKEKKKKLKVEINPKIFLWIREKEK